MTKRWIAIAAGLACPALMLMGQTNADRERILQNALRQDAPITDVPIMMELRVEAMNAHEYRVPMSTRIPASELVLARKTGAAKTSIDYLAEVKSESGDAVAAVRDKAEIKFGASDPDQPVLYNATFTLLEGRYTIKFLARDAETGRMGTFEKRFTVSPANAVQVAQAPVQYRPAAVEPDQTAARGGGGFGGAVAGGRGQSVTGSPVSAREERKTTQTLGDGTQIERSDSNLFFRDSAGRTRTETTNDGKTNITVVDPVGSLRLLIDPQAKTVTRITMPQGGRGGGPVGDTANAVFGLQVVVLGDTVALRGRRESAQNSKTEDLGLANQNGVMAQGTRTTLTIPKGEIGNNRDIHVINERWYSQSLQMVVKSTNSDPRSGVTTYDLTNISQNAPDPTLFKEPLGYTVTEQAGRAGAGRGSAAAGGGR
jgi:hypothetical protein